MPTIESEERPAGELEVVRAWRLAQLVRAGYESQIAGNLAERTDVDVHAAVSLLEHGCAPELAARILL